jgi:hypothetical protein
MGFWETYYHAKFITDMWSCQQIITQMFYHTNILSQGQIIILQIQRMLNSWMQAFPLWEKVWDKTVSL